ncbi:MAG TPA: alpha/beta hydrolase [Thermoleophilaceae bacterium]
MPPRLAAEESGSGPPVVLLHGLSATRRYVVHRSKALPRAGFRTIAYDARGHGESEAPDDPDAYDYADLCADLAALMDEHGLDRAALAGVSMGAHTALRFALEHPERVSAVVAITPGFTGEAATDTGPWDRMADGLERGGVEGFVSEWGARDVAERYREAALEHARQRLSQHRDLAAVARALRVVPRSEPFPGLSSLRAVEAPALVVGSRDGADPMHPLAVAEAYAGELPDARLLVEDEGRPPLAWQGARLSKAIAQFLGGAGSGGAGAGAGGAAG